MTERTERPLSDAPGRTGTSGGSGAGSLPGAGSGHGARARPDTGPGAGSVTRPAPRAPGEVRVWPRSFAGRLTAPLPGVRDFARMAREGGLRPADAEARRDIPRIPVEPAPLPSAGPDTVAVTWAGHATWVLRMGGLTVLTDPVWSSRILGTPARITPVGVRWEDLPRIDAVVISHNHYDHLDAPTLKRLPRETHLLVPAGLGAWCRRRRFTRVTELDWWEAVELPSEGGGVRFDFVPAHHWSKRTLTDTCRSLWGGWVVTDARGRRVYFAGDTGYGHWFAEIGRRFPGIDLALMPIGAYDPGWILRPVHTDPEEAVLALHDLGAHALAPMHWGTFLLSAESPLEPLTRVRQAWEAAGRSREDLWDLPIGGSRVLGD
ncbi:MBL fold metallo-hydrolase [Streptomyces sp. NPDC048639]|uniref:MBL fold metallo-hydrolase n=1 Tax=Streptomyces sp. NPDC048639 TaxID=3365581 RepID=UPI0037141C8C